MRFATVFATRLQRFFNAFSTVFQRFFSFTSTGECGSMALSRRKDVRCPVTRRPFSSQQKRISRAVVCFGAGDGRGCRYVRPFKASSVPSGGPGAATGDGLRPETNPHTRNLPFPFPTTLTLQQHIPLPLRQLSLSILTAPSL